MSQAHVLIITNKLDAHADHVVKLLLKRDAKVYRLNTEDLLSEQTVTWRPGRSGRLLTEHRQLSLDELTAVWYRKPSDYTLPEHLLEYEQFLREELRAIMGGIYRSTSCPLWVNDLDNQRRASYKLL